jgi:prophage regulatory protein
MYITTSDKYQDVALLRIQQIIGDKRLGIAPLIPISKSNFLARVASGEYPKPVKLGPKSIAWRAYEIKALIAGLPTPDNWLEGEWE